MGASMTVGVDGNASVVVCVAGDVDVMIGVIIFVWLGTGVSVG